VQIETGQYYLAQDGHSIVCAVGPAVELMVRTMPEPMRNMGLAFSMPLIPPAIEQQHRNDWGVAVVLGGHGDPRYKGDSTKPEGEGSILVGPGVRSYSPKDATEEHKEGLEKVMSLFPAKKVSVRWEETGKLLEDVEAGDFVRTVNGSICVSDMSAATDEDLEKINHNGDGAAQLGDFSSVVICGGIEEDGDPEGMPGTRIALNVDGDLAGRYKARAESADDDPQADYIRAIKEDMRPVCIVRPVVTDPETN
jgi:hypothetical protein